jgi:hypothetical protein
MSHAANNNLRANASIAAVSVHARHQPSWEKCTATTARSLLMAIIHGKPGAITKQDGLPMYEGQTWQQLTARAFPIAPAWTNGGSNDGDLVPHLPRRWKTDPSVTIAREHAAPSTPKTPPGASLKALLDISPVRGPPLHSHSSLTLRAPEHPCICRSQPSGIALAVAAIPVQSRIEFAVPKLQPVR